MHPSAGTTRRGVRPVKVTSSRSAVLRYAAPLAARCGPPPGVSGAQRAEVILTALGEALGGGEGSRVKCSSRNQSGGLQEGEGLWFAGAHHAGVVFSPEDVWRSASPFFAGKNCLSAFPLL